MQYSKDYSSIVSVSFLSATDLTASLAEMLEKRGYSQQESAEIEKSITAREKMFSTYYTDEVIVPRAETSRKTLCLCAGLLKESFSMGDENIRIIFLILYSKEMKSDYLSLLSSLYRALASKQFKQRLLSSTTEDEAGKQLAKGLHEIEL
ncbi:MAG: PTS sugar transporter subunit IIA [bacterium]